MGDTSSGKSSLLSALAQLQLPSNDKITTRCPLRLRMEKSDIKRAEVGIKWDAASSYKDEAAWPLCRLDSWEDVSAKISAAQDLILERGQVEVAFDVVEVNVYGPECTDLTLIDLPGIVRTVAKNETKRLIEDIKDLLPAQRALCHLGRAARQSGLSQLADHGRRARRGPRDKTHHPRHHQAGHD